MREVVRPPGNPTTGHKSDQREVSSQLRRPSIHKAIFDFQASENCNPSIESYKQ